LRKPRAQKTVNQFLRCQKIIVAQKAVLVTTDNAPVTPSCTIFKGYQTSNCASPLHPISAGTLAKDRNIRGVIKKYGECLNKKMIAVKDTWSLIPLKILSFASSTRIPSFLPLSESSGSPL